MTTSETPTPLPEMPISSVPTLSLYSLCIKLLFECRSPGKGRQKKPIVDLCDEVDSRYNKANEPVYLQYIKDHQLYAESKIAPLINTYMEHHYGFRMKREVSKPLQALMETLISTPSDDPEFSGLVESLETRISHLAATAIKHKTKIVSQAMLDAKPIPTAEEVAATAVPTTPLPQLETKTPADEDVLDELCRKTQQTLITVLADDDILEE